MSSRQGRTTRCGRKLTFIEGRVDGGKPSRDDVLEEVEADHFAANFLIPKAQIEELRPHCEQDTLDVKVVRKFANAHDIAPAIVVTRLQHLGWNVPEALNVLKHDLSWAPPGTYVDL